MRIKFLVASLGIAVLCAAGLMLAQAPKSEEITPDFTQQNTFVLAPVTVFDRNDNFVNNLTVLDFQLYDNGVLQKITEDVAQRPISLVVAIQSSSKAQLLIPTIQKSASLYGPLVAGETGEVAVLAFDHRIQTLTGFTSNQDEIKAAFAKLKPGSVNHHLDDAAMEGINMLRNRGKDRKKILLLISETRDEGSSFNPRDVLTGAEFADVVIYTVNMSTALNSLTSKTEPNRPNPIPPEFRSPLPMGTPRTLTTDAQTNMGNYTPAIKEIYTQLKALFVPNPLEVYTQETGGREHNFATMAGLEEAINLVGREIHSQYMLTYLPNNRNEGGYHDITVRVSKPDLSVRTRRGYWIAPNAPSPTPAKK